MDFGCEGSAGGSGGGDKDQGLEGSEGLKRKWSDLEATMKAVKNAMVKENTEKSAKIRRLMEDNVRLEQTVLRLENSPFQTPIRPMERQNPFAVFPPEVWEAIIEQMNRSSELEMLCLAFPQLEPSVKKIKKTLFLFKNVIPFLCEHLDLKDINNCRRVCESWNEDLCSLFATSNSPNLLSVAALSNKQNRTTTLSLRRAYCFKDHGKIQNFLTKMGDHPENPFFGRFLCFVVNTQTELDNFWHCALQLVEKFGEHIWSLEVSCFREPYNLIEFYKELQKVLIYVPNLRDLTVHCFFYGWRPSTTNTNMADLIGSCPLPPLPYLQSVKLSLNGETAMMSAFTPLFSPQIRRLELFQEIWGNDSFKDELLRGLINLEYLYVKLKCREDILRLFKFPCRSLKKLFLSSDCCKAISITSEQLCSLLEKFSRLKHLDFLYCQVECSSCFTSKMRFSSLQSLQIAVDVDEDDLLHNLDFLLWFPSLKYLDIYKRSSSRTVTYLTVDKMDQHSKLKIRKYLYNGQVLDSNIWTLIPSLELLNARGHGKFTREMFENRID